MLPTKDDVNTSLQKIGLGVLEAADDPMGAPGGAIYAAMQSHGATLNQYQSFMSGLTGQGMLIQDGDCFHITEKGKAFKEKLQSRFGSSVPAAKQSFAATKAKSASPSM